MKGFSYFRMIQYIGKTSTSVMDMSGTLKKSAFHSRNTDGIQGTTLATNVSKPKPAKFKPSCFRDTCKVCKGSHELHKCLVSLVKDINWRRRFFKFNAVCYHCLSPSHLQRECPQRKGCIVQDCAHSSNHQPLLHLAAPTTSQVDEEEEVVVRSRHQLYCCHVEITPERSVLRRDLGFGETRI